MVSSDDTTPREGACEGHEGPIDPNASMLQEWVLYDAAEQNSWQSVVYGNGKFVAVSRDGTNRVMTSTDGRNWTAYSAPQSTWSSVTYGNGMFVAVTSNTIGSGLRVMTSTDGENWISRDAPAGYWTSVTYGNGRFVAVAHSGTNRVMTSTDGENWTVYSAPVISGGNTSSDRLVTYGNGQFVAVAGAGARSVMLSSDGQNWTTHETPAVEYIRSVVYGGGKYIITSGNNPSSYRMLMSTDGKNWTEVRSGTGAAGWFPVYGNGNFAIGTTNYDRVQISPNGTEWRESIIPQSGNWKMSYGKGCFVAVSSSGDKRVALSCK